MSQIEIEKLSFHLSYVNADADAADAAAAGLNSHWQLAHKISIIPNEYKLVTVPHTKPKEKLQEAGEEDEQEESFFLEKQLH